MKTKKDNNHHKHHGPINTDQKVQLESGERVTGILQITHSRRVMCERVGNPNT